MAAESGQLESCQPLRMICFAFGAVYKFIQTNDMSANQSHTSVSKRGSSSCGPAQLTDDTQSWISFSTPGVSSRTRFSPSRSSPFHVSPRCFFSSFSRSYWSSSSNSIRVAAILCHMRRIRMCISIQCEVDEANQILRCTLVFRTRRGVATQTVGRLSWFLKRASLRTSPTRLRRAKASEIPTTTANTTSAFSEV